MARMVRRQGRRRRRGWSGCNSSEGDEDGPAAMTETGTRVVSLQWETCRGSSRAALANVSEAFKEVL